VSDVLTLSLRNLLAHRTRLALTVTAVTLGVAFVCGAFVLSDTTGAAFDRLFGDVAHGSDLTIRSHTHTGAAATAGQGRPMDASVLGAVSTVEGVDAAEGTVTGYTLVLDRHGRTVDGKAGIGTNLHTDATLGTEYQLRAGHLPHGPGEVALDSDTAAKAGYRPGESVRLVLESGPASFTLAGTVHIGPREGSTLAGTTMAAFDLPTAQHVLGRDAKLDQIDVRAQAGLDPLILRARISPVLPASAEAVTSQQVADESKKLVRGNLKMFTTVLVGFAAVSLLVGAFVIFNTFSVLVAQRRREVALMRAVGATRGQVLRGLVTEAAAIGAFSSLLGLAGGAGLSIGLLQLLGAMGVDLPTTSPVIAARTVVVAIAIGLLVTVAAAVVPALAATRVAAVEAMRETTVASASTGRRRLVVGSVLLTSAAALLTWASSARDQGPAAALGAVLGFAGLLVCGPLLARGFARAVDRGAGTSARPAARGWRLAARNVARAPQRAAATALALTIGLAVVAAATVVASSIKASVDDAVTGGNHSDLMLKPAGMMSMSGLTPAVAATLEAKRDRLGLAAVAELRSVAATGDPAGPRAHHATPQVMVGGVDPGQAAQVLDLDLRSGTLGALDPGTVLLSAKQAKAVDARQGDTVSIDFPETGRRSFTVAGIFDRDALIGAAYLLPMSDYAANVTSRLDTDLMLRFTDATRAGGIGAAEAAVTRSLAGYPNVEVQDQAEFAAEQKANVNQVLGLVTAMLLLAVVIAVLGIINTLVLSVLERTRELGLLRAVGGTRRQVRSVIRREAVLMAALGAISGAALGTAVGTAGARALYGQGITSTAIPAPTLVLYVALAGLVGVVAAIGPARRASRVDVLKAITVD